MRYLVREFYAFAVEAPSFLVGGEDPQLFEHS